MSLQDYHQKRNFKKTKEPSGFKEINHTKLHFVIHKHKASHLHYDLRLEMNGVLKSWAVPKGPSLIPKEKRLAIRVEDHPYQYKDFEGIIPKGNYGAGNVIIWDEGYYEPPESNISNMSHYFLENLKKGHIAFILHGQKLQGEFVLIKRDTNDNKKNAWLLIKKNDAYASLKKDILKQNKSVRSNLTVDEIDQSPSKNLILKKLPKISIPSKVKSMLAQTSQSPFNDKAWLFEIKWDGYRIMAYLKKNKVTLLSRNLKDYTDLYSLISHELSKLNISAVLDGEVVAIDEKGHPKFQVLQQFQKTGQGHLVYYVFDIIWLQGKDLSNLSLIQRKSILKQILPTLSHVHFTNHIEETGKAFFALAKKEGLEGIMAKKKDSTYIHGRSVSWLKIKTKNTQEAIICGYTAPRGSRPHFGSLILGMYENEKLKYIGHSGGGFTQKDLKEMKLRLDQLVQNKCPFALAPKMNTNITWTKPKLVCEVAFTEWTREGYLRHPVFLRLREDKKPKSVHKEIINSPSTHKQAEKTEDKIVTINRHPVKLSNLNKVYWPKEGYRKEDVISYYRSIAPIILPYLKNRPESLNRYPNGILEKNFFQKNITDAPAWIKTILIHSTHDQKDVSYLLCQNEASLVYMANLGCIEINPWISQLKSLDHPDFCLLDLDPEGVQFSEVIKVAQAFHRLLDKLEVNHYCKTSGSRGLHICIPLNAKYNYVQSKQFAELISIFIHHQLPDITSLVLSPKKRQGKVYLDFLQNNKGQTMAAPYSLRPKPGATISTPLQWKEVNQKLDPHQFNLKTISRRLDKIDDIWKPVLGKGANIKECLIKLQKLVFAFL